jgi:opacity protein-like surface antigen
MGVTAGIREAQDGDFRVSVQPIRDPRLTYTVPPKPATQVGPDFDTAAFSALHAGWRFDVGPWVAGVEGEVRQDAAQTRYDSGLLVYDSFANPFVACGSTALGCLSGINDFVSARASVDNTISVKASIGIPVSDRLLVSAYVGPSVAFGEVVLSQRSQIRIVAPPVRTPGCMLSCSFPVTTFDGFLDAQRSGDDTALGLVAGVNADFKLTENVMARAQLGYARYEALRLDGESFETRVWAQPVSVDGSFGLTLRF